jgi:Zn-dependent protease
VNSVLTARCSDCGAEIAKGLYACPGCKRLVYAADLQRLAENAEAAERAGDLTTALGAWRRALELLPPGTLQGKTITKRMQSLSAAIDGRAPAARKSTRGKGKGTWGAIAAGAGAILLKAKALVLLLLANIKLLFVGLLKLPTLLSMLLYARLWGGHSTGTVVGVVASLYVHEMGHVATLRRYGIAASAPMFVPGVGALVRLRQYPTDAHEEARTGLAGPVWGLAAAVVAAVLGWLAHLPPALHVASLGATINAFNLLPVWQLDGARGLKALSRRERLMVALAGLMAAVVFHQWMPGIVGATTLARAWEKTAPPAGDARVAYTFAGLLLALGALGMIPIGDALG